MLSHHDLGVIARDPTLPGLAILLDGERALGLLQQIYPELALSDLGISYLKYKPRTNCLAGFTVRSAGAREAVWISAKAYPEKEYAKERARYEQAGGAGRDASPLLFVDAWQLVVWSFPRDRKVAALVELEEAATRRRLLRDLVPDMPDLWPAGLETLCYKSERRYVGRLLVDGEARALIKVYEAQGFKNASRAARTISGFAAREILRVAGPLGISRDKCIIVSRWLDGQPLRKQLASGAWGLNQKLGQLAGVGAALAGFHQEEPGSLSMTSPENEALSVLAAANAAAFLHPPLAARLSRLATKIAAELLAMPLQTCPIHGDFSSDQVLVDGANGGNVAIIDYDQARIGDPAADIGSFLAQLFYDEAADSFAVGAAEAMGSAMLTGYMDALGQRRTMPRQSLYVAAKLLQLAPQGFRSRHPQWPDLTARLVRHAAVFLRGYARHKTGK